MNFRKNIHPTKLNIKHLGTYFLIAEDLLKMFSEDDNILYEET